VRRRSRTSTRYSKFAYSSELASAMGLAFDQAVDRVRAADATGHFETQAGVQVTGADVAWAYGIGVLAEHIPTQQPALIRLRENVSDEVCRMPGSVIVQFGDGAGTVLAGLPGYVASVTVESGRVINISYVPSTNSPLWLEYSADHEWVEALRAVAAAAARNGLLAVDREDARRFGDVVRQAKKWDPTLGLYAALAYADVGLKKQLQSVETYMRRDLRANLFDVALLAGSMSEYPHSRVLSAAGVPTVPFCPMLSQTWSFFRPRGVEPALGVGADGLRPGAESLGQTERDGAAAGA